MMVHSKLVSLHRSLETKVRKILMRLRINMMRIEAVRKKIMKKVST